MIKSTPSNFELQVSHGTPKEKFSAIHLLSILGTCLVGNRNWFSFFFSFSNNGSLDEGIFMCFRYDGHVLDHNVDLFS